MNDINRFLLESQALPVSYTPIGIVREPPAEGRFDEQVVAIGHGADDFERARAALLTWKQFAIAREVVLDHRGQATRSSLS